MKKILLSALLLLMFIGGCATLKSTSRTSAVDLGSTSWQLKLLRGEAVAAQGDSFTLIFNPENKLGGKGSCNLLVGSYSSDASGSLRLSPMGLTRSACPDMQAEMEYVKMLEGVSGYSVVDNTLILMAGDKEVAHFFSTTQP